MRNAYIIHDFMEISHELFLSILVFEVFDPLMFEVLSVLKKMANVTETESRMVITIKVKMLITAFVQTPTHWDKDISSPPYTVNTT